MRVEYCIKNLFSDALLNPLSPDYNEARELLLNALIDALRDAAAENEMQITDIMVIFLSKTNRRKRSEGSSTYAKLDISLRKEMLEEKDKLTQEQLKVSLI